MTTRKKKHSLTTTERQSEEAGGDNYVGKDFFLTIKIFHWNIFAIALALVLVIQLDLC